MTASGATTTTSATKAPVPKAAVAKVRKPRTTFILHDPRDLSLLGKYKSTDFRYAALKVASRGHTQILLRKTHTKEFREFKGASVTLDTPKVIKRGDREKPIIYTKKPVVSFVKKWIHHGALDDGDSLVAQTPAAVAS